MVVRLAAVVHGIPRFGQCGQTFLEYSSVASHDVPRVDAVQDVGATALGQRTYEEYVSDIARRLLPVALGQIRNDGIQHGLLVVFRH